MRTSASDKQLAFDDEHRSSGLSPSGNRNCPGTELAILSTCNRVELYAAGVAEAPSHRELVAALAGFHQLPAAILGDKAGHADRSSSR